MKHTRKIIAVYSACMIMTAAFTGCGDDKNGGYSSSYTPHDNNNVTYEEYADAEETETAEESPYDEYNYDEYVEPNYPSPNEEYQYYTESGFKDPKSEPLSTFSADVDTASYTNARRLLEDYTYVPQDSVRIEEFLNYFDYDYPQPDDGTAFGRYVEIADCPWNTSHKLMMCGIQGEKIEDEETPPSNLVFLIDSSGSMNEYNKLPLVQTAFSMLAEQLDKNDRISIVTYAGTSQTILKGEKGSNKDEILSALYSITASGGTNGEGGIKSAYKLAEQYFIKGGNNRVILATDGDLNIGISSPEELEELIAGKRDKGIYLSVLGFGTDNYKDDNMEALADNGNGNYSYIDSVDEAERVLVQEMSGTLYTIAKDVKIQVEFNPAQVKSYRLIGYDNRLMNAEDFLDDTKDAGEVGSGHSVTAFYEIELNNSGAEYHGVPLEFAGSQETTENSGERSEICKLSIAYKTPVDEKNINISDLYGMEKYSANPSDSMKLAQAVSEFGMILRQSEYMGDSSFKSVLGMLSDIDRNDDGKVTELKELVKTAEQIYS